MAETEKVLQALPLANMTKRADGVRFSVLSKNGFYAEIGGQIVMEFDTNQDAIAVVDSLNAAIIPVLNNFKNSYNAKIRVIIA